MGSKGSLSQRGLLSGILMFFASLGASPSVDAGEYRWTDYLGSHYRTQPWAKAVRQPGGVSKASVPAGATLPSELDSRHTDPVKAERDRQRAHRQRERRRQGQYDPEALVAEVETELKQLFPSQAAVLNLGSPGKSRRIGAVQGFIEALETDNAASWKADVRKRVERLARVQGSETQLYWQLGNEVNSAWSNAEGIRGSHDVASVPLYVEYFVAPAVEAIEAASTEVFGAPGRIHIILGSIGGAGNPKSLQWLDAVLSYRVQGSMAPGQRGRTVSELVDVISIHYLVSNPDTTWRKKLDELRNRWVGQGRIKGIWATEELGKRRGRAGAGGATALQVLSRYLHWWAAHELSPDQSRVFFWGSHLGRPGTRGNDSLAELHGFLADAVLVERTTRIRVEPNRGELEHYAYESKKDARMVIFVSPVSDTGDRLSAVELDESIPAPAAVTLVKYSADGRVEVPVRIESAGGRTRILPTNAVELRRGSAAMLLLTPGTLTGASSTPSAFFLFGSPPLTGFQALAVDKFVVQ